MKYLEYKASDSHLLYSIHCYYPLTPLHAWIRGTLSNSVFIPHSSQMDESREASMDVFCSLLLFFEPTQFLKHTLEQSVIWQSSYGDDSTRVYNLKDLERTVEAWYRWYHLAVAWTSMHIFRLLSSRKITMIRAVLFDVRAWLWLFALFSLTGSDWILLFLIRPSEPSSDQEHRYMSNMYVKAFTVPLCAHVLANWMTPSPCSPGRNSKKLWSHSRSRRYQSRVQESLQGTQHCTSFIWQIQFSSLALWAMVEWSDRACTLIRSRSRFR